MGRYFDFRDLISVRVFKVLYILGAIGVIIGAIVFLSLGSEWGQLGLPEIVALFFAVVMVELLWRLICEGAIVVFRIHESLERIEQIATDMALRPAPSPAFPSPEVGLTPPGAPHVPLAEGVLPARLRVVSGARTGQIFPLGRDNLSMGRNDTNDIVLDDPMVSGVHCRLRYGQGAWYVQDAGSSNGTFVNGERVAARRLVDGDRLELGGTQLVFEVLPEE